ncbi:hypothetical protein HETIRDRAFT_449800 [Heterobasidion irregulare TC 32-1]|uniref:Uncharacterized protein n=1 Tax=Heterobasidion irregulare (strain TC 32-1) TaxID=747525 RepID=W4KG60_HETIT|nr:uncharacterized protein HETIRDRAFT_449800 [Heterobasidion irregulare TC 32-1]ETW84275.1 hypothetical protein HETIRDRAFT_449800 [Heterobasidion irregulare TC 32-1]
MTARGVTIVGGDIRSMAAQLAATTTTITQRPEAVRSLTEDPRRMDVDPRVFGRHARVRRAPPSHKRAPVAASVHQVVDKGVAPRVHPDERAKTAHLGT